MGKTEHGDLTQIHHEILRTVVGSGVHGIAIAGLDDHDEMGIYIEPPEAVLGYANRRDNYVWRTQPEGVRSGPGDTDLVMYSLARYLALATKGNPTVLVPLFAPTVSVLACDTLGLELRWMRDAFLSQQAVHRFLGYMEGQRTRMMGGGKRNRVPNRPELIERYGWDVKYGSHALRLALQGLEIAVHHRLTLPMVMSHRDLVLSVKRGEIPRDEVDRLIQELERQTTSALKSSDLPPQADTERITAWAVQAQRRAWGW